MAVEMVARTRRRFSRAEYYRMVEVGILGPHDRVELIRGEIVEKMPGGRRHRAFVDNLNQLLVARIRDRAIVSIQMPLGLLDDTVPEPDVTVQPLTLTSCVAGPRPSAAVARSPPARSCPPASCPGRSGDAGGSHPPGRAASRRPRPDRARSGR